MLGTRARLASLVAVLAALVLAPTVWPASDPPWKLAADLRTQLADAERALLVGEDAQARALVRQAAPSASHLAELLRGEDLGKQYRMVERAAVAGDEVELAAARAALQTTVLSGAYRKVLASIERGEIAEAERWLLVREFRPPTRFSRPGADATLALTLVAAGKGSAKEALAAVRADYLDTYQARLRTALESADRALERGFPSRLAAESARARGYFAVLEPSFRRQRGPAASERVGADFDRLVRAALDQDEVAYSEARAAVERALAGFRAAPLAREEEIRRAGQFLRFLALVPIEYGRGVADGHVTVPFEIQEAVTFRDGAAQAFADLESVLAKRDPAAVRRIEELIAAIGEELAAASQGRAVAAEEAVEAKTSEALELAEGAFPEEWQDAGATADFDVIRTSLDRVVAAVRAGEYGTAEQARLEAYAFFEFGPEQRLRGLAPDLFVRTESLFWYGADGFPGLAQLIRRKAAPEDVVATREALDTALADSEAAVGAGPTSAAAVVTNTAIIVFREGLEAVLILAALTAGLVGARRRLRRPLFVGAAAALLASVATFIVAKTILSSLVRYGEKLEAIVSLVAIAVLLLILNWFFHRVYWADHLAGLHGRKKRILKGAGFSAAAAQFAGLATLGFTAVYREGFETVLFLQALALEAGATSVIEGAALGAVGVAAVGVLTIALQRKLPHKRMLELTAVLILGVLVIMVGKTIQVCQVVGWLPVHPIGDLRLPYWAGLWFGIFPTWEGVAAQLGAAVFVIGSYAAAEWLRARRRHTRLRATVRRAPSPSRALPGIEASSVSRNGNDADGRAGLEGTLERRARPLAANTGRRR
ncbi:MAG: FTR1 family protein [Gaiellaceae bacterium MAG52_C11]|nr:FTR1 family protein [Candidatus Gaiellasilicea maunaloa]